MTHSDIPGVMARILTRIMTKALVVVMVSDLIYRTYNSEASVTQLGP